MKHISDCTVLHNQVKMPWLGLGVYKIPDGEEVRGAVRYALEHGYRSIDTAALYENEAGVGQAVKESGLRREDLFITTKVWNTDQGYESTLAAFETSRKKLAMDMIDLYLIHWPVKGKYKETWKALEKLYKEGWVRAIGVSNFHAHHLEDLLADCEIKPMVNQVEYHPLLSQQELRRFCQAQGIQMEAWSPLARGQILNDSTVLTIAGKHQKTPAQIVLRWDLQNGVVTIPKSSSEERIAENAGIFDFVLSADDMAALDSLNENKRVGPDPDNFSF
ncbi:aldo/keto reductase [Brevibacillus sp. B_LB10_24]|uniref:aldo/keto reductase n=1 Tax=Brevibacillus sp. B_LB10_24 TaxID=3380645 RepID=UPI0038BC01D6